VSDQVSAKTKLRIASELSLPIEAVTEALGFLGRRGSGKSYAAQRLAEEFHQAGAQFVVLDPVGNWWALRLDRDGKSPGIPVPVFGGLRGDIPIDPSAGKLVADVIVDRHLSAVIDVSQFESDADKARFATDFGARFYYRKKAAPSAVHLFLEEGQEFAPQNPQREEGKMLHVYTRLAKLGRNFGIGFSIISQRPQEVNKKVLNLTELLFVFQLTGPQERKAVEGWIKDKGIDEDLGSLLPKLERGRPHAWSPAWLRISQVVGIHPKRTFDGSSTPKVGAARPANELSPIDLAQLQEQLAASIAKAKEEDPKLLRARIRELEATARKTVTSPAPAVPIDDGQIKHLETAISQLRILATTQLDEIELRLNELQQQLLGPVHALITVVAKQRAQLDRLKPVRASTSAKVSSRAIHTPAAGHRSAPVEVRPSSSNGDQRVSKTPARMLAAMRFYERFGTPQPTKQAVAAFVGIRHTTGTYSNYLSELRTAGLIRDVSRESIELTDEGRAMATDDAPRSLAEFHARWQSKLSGTPGRMLEVLILRYPKPITKELLASAVGISHTTGTFSNYLSELRVPGLMRDVSRSEVVASDLLFPEGLE
jgi:hypothetical protein